MRAVRAGTDPKKKDDFAVHARYAEAGLVQATRCAIGASHERFIQLLHGSSMSHRLGWKDEVAESSHGQVFAATTVDWVVHGVRPEAAAAAAAAVVMVALDGMQSWMQSRIGR